MKPRREDAETAEMQRLWEETPLTAVEIAAQFGITRNALIGMASRRGWVSSTVWTGGREKPETVFDRMSRLERRMDEVLAETRGVGHIAVEASKTARKGWETRRDGDRKAGIFNA